MEINHQETQKRFQDYKAKRKKPNSIESQYGPSRDPFFQPNNKMFILPNGASPASNQFFGEMMHGPFIPSESSPRRPQGPQAGFSNPIAPTSREIVNNLPLRSQKEKVTRIMENNKTRGTDPLKAIDSGNPTPAPKELLDD